jgi:radical SAM protein with 4Fe4S-binding SPASM domain
VRESLCFNRAALRTCVSEFYGQDCDGIVKGTSLSAQAVSFSAATCTAHVDECRVDADGKIALCFAHDTGSLGDGTLGQVLDGERARAFRHDVETTRRPCQSCNFLKRCLTPSILDVTNHFAESVCDVMGAGTIQALSFDSDISDRQAADLFVRAISRRIAVFDIAETEEGWTARHVEGVGSDDLQPTYSAMPAVRAATRDQLHQLMVGALARSTPVIQVTNPRKAERELSALGSVAVFGASLSGEQCVELLTRKNIQCACFIDNAPPLSGRFLERPVLHPDAFRQQGPRVDAIVVATHGAVEVQEQCRRLGLHDKVIDAMPLIVSAGPVRHAMVGTA